VQLPEIWKISQELKFAFGSVSRPFGNIGFAYIYRLQLTYFSKDPENVEEIKTLESSSKNTLSER